MESARKLPAAGLAFGLALIFGAAGPTSAAAPVSVTGSNAVLAQAMVPPTGMMDQTKPTPMEQRYRARYPQSARVGDLIGLPVVDLHSSTIGRVQHIVRTPQGKIDFIVSYSWWWGRFGRPVTVPIEVLGIEGRQLVSLDMAPSAYAAAPTWQPGSDMILPDDATIRVALGRS